MTSMLEKDGAEFPGISKNQNLYLQEDAMAQLVRFRVDDQTAIANYLSSKFTNVCNDLWHGCRISFKTLILSFQL